MILNYITYRIRSHRIALLYYCYYPNGMKGTFFKTYIVVGPHLDLATVRKNIFSKPKDICKCHSEEILRSTSIELQNGKISKKNGGESGKGLQRAPNIVMSAPSNTLVCFVIILIASCPPNSS